VKTNRPRLRKVYILPNSFTAMNLFLGVQAIYNVLLFMTAHDPTRFERGCWFVILAAVFDAFDGLVARLTHSQSEFGLQFDSLADVVSFGVAPSVAAFAVLSKLDGGVPDRFAGAICAFFAICGALRLARYNVQAHGTERTAFVGLPIPGGGGGLVLSLLFIEHYKLMDSSQTTVIPWSFGLTAADLVATLLRVLVVLLALLMVSEVPYPSVMRRFRLRRRMSFRTFVVLAVVGVVVWAVRRHEGLAVCLPFLMFLSFAFYFPVALVVNRVLGREPAPAPGGSSAGGPNVGGPNVGGPGAGGSGTLPGSSRIFPSGPSAASKPESPMSSDKNDTQP
jgi:CDP-diacylglycerol--serine O-phosphatidyltransferase